MTRAEPGELDDLLVAEGFDVVHVPLIEICEPLDPAPLEAAIANIGGFDWLVVTSGPGAERVGGAARGHSSLRLAAVGSATAAVLAHRAGRDVDVIPARASARDLCDAMPQPVGAETALIAQADRADDTAQRMLAERGYQTTVVTAYRTVVRKPSSEERAQLRGVDAVIFASGSAARSWREAMGTATPSIVVAIGESTASVANEIGLQVTHVSADQSMAGLARTTAVALTTH